MTTIRSCATRLIELLDQVGDDVLTEETAINEVMGELLALPGLDTMNATPARSAGEGGLGWLYYDGDLRIVRGTIAAGTRLEPHNHGSWNLFGVYKGAVHYQSYRRLDDGTVPYYAELAPADHRTMRNGDTTVMPGPPHDIHGVVGLAPISVTVLVARGFFNPAREQYDPSTNTYLVFEGDGLDAKKG